jgi:integrase
MPSPPLTCAMLWLQPMGRRATGTIRRHGDHFDARITLADGTRPWFHLPAGWSRAKAREKAATLSEQARRGEAVMLPKDGDGQPVPEGESYSAWVERWLAAREAKGLTSVETDRGRLKKWVAPVLCDKALVAVTREDIEAIVEALDAAVLAGASSWKTAVNIWGLVSKMFKDACASKTKALRVRKDNPAIGVPGPDRGAKKAKAYLYPSEFLKIAACPDISLAWRRAVALSIYLYTRPGELRALRLEEDVALDIGTVHVHRSIDREGEAKTTKTKATRRVPVEATALPLLQALHNEAKGRGPVIELPDDRHLARALQGILKKAGITRPELFAKDATRKNLTWYDLRATGITWMAIRGDDPLKIMSRAGHENFATTQGYIREAEAVRAGFGEVFPPLPACLLVPGEGNLALALAQDNDEAIDGEPDDPEADEAAARDPEEDPQDESDGPATLRTPDPPDPGAGRDAIPEGAGQRAVFPGKSSRESSQTLVTMRNYSGGAGNRTRVRKASGSPSFTCVAAVSPAAEFADSAATYPSRILAALSRASSRSPALVVDARGVLGRPSRWTALRFLRPRERARCRSHVSRPA